MLRRAFEPRFLTIIGCWFIASAVLDYETPQWFNILYSLATLAPFAAIYCVWTFAARPAQPGG
jgi:hypothetical protein